MEIVSPRFHGWTEVPIDDLECHLKTCNDYTREGYCGATVYTYRHNRQRFAVVVLEDGIEKAFVPPVKD